MQKEVEIFRKEVFLAIILLFIILFINIISATSMPIYVKPLSGDGSLNPNTAYNYTFNWTTDSSCNNVIFSNSSLTITTGSDGIGFINLTIPDNLASMPNYLCEYRNSALRKVHTLSTQFFNRVYITNLNVSQEIYTSGNITANTGFFDWLGSLANRITSLFVIDVNVSNNVGVGGNLTVNTDTLFVDSNAGKVGIGTASPDQKLEIIGQTQFTHTDGAGDHMTIQPFTDGVTYFNAFGASANEGGFDFRVNDGSVHALWIDKGGNVGIGTAEPTSTLHVGNGNFTVWKSCYISEDCGTGGTCSNNLCIEGDVVNNAFFHGNVGIGTTSPGEKLEVAGNVKIGGQLGISGASRVRAKRIGVQSVPSATSTIVQYNSEDFDNLGEWDAVTNFRFQPQQAGYYYVKASVTLETAAWTAGMVTHLDLFTNGNLKTIFNYHLIEGAVSGRQNLVGSETLYLIPSDYIEIRIVHNQGSNVNIVADSAYSYITIHRLS